ncbi:MAG TPA: DUF1549 domain-containing protein [Pirellulaceae bacterium]|nr:DUF1549 domain-containing protein [Pirellulaceae bacterium]
MRPLADRRTPQPFFPVAGTKPATRFVAMLATGLALSAALATAVPTLAAKPETRTSPPPDAIRTAGEVNRILRQETLVGKTNQVAGRVDDEVFLRRVSLDLIGRAPTPEETTVFTLDTDPHKREKVVDKLLADRRFGENWGRYWRDVIFYRRTEERAILAQDTATKYLIEQLNLNTPWDQVATAYITAKGDVSEDGSTALILAQRGEPEGVVAEVSRIFCGIQIQCAQCHDHPTDRWKRDQFHHMAAFFPRVALRPELGGDKRTFHVTVTDFEPRFRPRNADQRVIGSLEHYMPDLKDPSAKGELMEPVFFVTGQSLKKGTPDSDRRTQLASWITSRDNPWFAKALVNRLWGELVGEGFYEPIDDMGPDRECSAPNTLNRLAAAFTDSGYDYKWLMKTITSTEAYQRTSRSRREPEDAPFAANAAQRLRADQLFNQIVDLLGLDDAESPRMAMAGPMAGRRNPRFLFNQVFGFDPSSPRDEVAGSIPQALVLMNSPMLNGAISANRGVLGRLLPKIRDDEQLTAELYLKALGREPSTREVATCLAHVKSVGNRGEAFEDILWSLINSTEFLHRR